jgi:hypothetical protein
MSGLEDVAVTWVGSPEPEEKLSAGTFIHR